LHSISGPNFQSDQTFRRIGAASKDQPGSFMFPGSRRDVPIRAERFPAQDKDAEVPTVLSVRIEAIREIGATDSEQNLRWSVCGAVDQLTLASALRG